MGIFSSKLKYDVSKVDDIAQTKLLIFTEHVNATYYINFHYPLINLGKKRPISFQVLSQEAVRKQSSSNIKKFIHKINKNYKPDLVIFSRYSVPHGSELVKYFKNAGIPTIYHIDDNLLEIPEFLGKEIRKRQGADKAIREREEQIKHADIVYVSTSELAAILRNKFTNLEVYQKMSTPYLKSLINSDVIRHKNNGKGITIGYMGSKGHKYDLEMIVPDLDRLLSENQGLRFEVFGSIKMPEMLIKYGDRVKSHSYRQSYNDFLQYLYELHWDLGLAPLKNHKFNLCKTPIKYLEYTACGIPTIASNVIVYSSDINGDNGILCNDGEWYSTICKLLNNIDDLSALQRNAESYCSENYSLKIMEDQLDNLIIQAVNRAM